MTSEGGPVRIRLLPALLQTYLLKEENHFELETIEHCRPYSNSVSDATDTGYHALKHNLYNNEHNLFLVDFMT